MVTIFTDGSASGMAVVVSPDKMFQTRTTFTSAQKVKIAAAATLAFSLCQPHSQPLCRFSVCDMTVLVTESAIINHDKTQINDLLMELQTLLR